MIPVYYINKDNFDPEIIANIDLEKNIVAVTIDGNKIITDDGYRLFLTNKNDIMLQNQKIIGNTAYVIDFNPHIKWSVPRGLDLVFGQPTIRVVDIINCSYTDTLWYEDSLITHNLMSFKFCVHIDKERTYSSTKILAGEKLLQIDILTNLLHMDQYVEIQNIYVIQNSFIFEEFKDHFER
jgi:hypothetical protein